MFSDLYNTNLCSVGRINSPRTRLQMSLPVLSLFGLTALQWAAHTGYGNFTKSFTRINGTPFISPQIALAEFVLVR